MSTQQSVIIIPSKYRYTDKPRIWYHRAIVNPYTGLWLPANIHATYSAAARQLVYSRYPGWGCELVGKVAQDAKRDWSMQKIMRAIVVAELCSDKHLQAKPARKWDVDAGDWQDLRVGVCFAYVCHRIALEYGFHRTIDDCGTRWMLGINSGNYEKLVKASDAGIPFDEIADLLEAMPYRS